MRKKLWEWSQHPGIPRLVEGAQHELTAPGFVWHIFFWPRGSCRGAQLQHGVGNGPIAGYRTHRWLGQLLGFGVTVLQSPRAEISWSFPVEATGRQTGWSDSHQNVLGGNEYCNISEKNRSELKGVTQLYSSSLARMCGNVLYLNCCLLERFSSKCGWKTVKQMCKKSYLCNVCAWPERLQCVIFGPALRDCVCVAGQECSLFCSLACHRLWKVTCSCCASPAGHQGLDRLGIRPLWSPVLPAWLMLFVIQKVKRVFPAVRTPIEELFPEVQ